MVVLGSISLLKSWNQAKFSSWYIFFFLVVVVEATEQRSQRSQPSINSILIDCWIYKHGLRCVAANPEYDCFKTLISASNGIGPGERFFWCRCIDAWMLHGARTWICEIITWKWSPISNIITFSLRVYSETRNGKNTFILGPAVEQCLYISPIPSHSISVGPAFFAVHSLYTNAMSFYRPSVAPCDSRSLVTKS